MVAGGVALWSAPVVAAATFSRSDARDEANRRLQNHLSRNQTTDAPTLPDGQGGAVAQAPEDCNSYPPGTCVNFVCGGPYTDCGDGAGGFDCFCDVDATAACVCRNDAFCSDLATCNAGNGNGDCPPGYFCIPTSCCGIAKCAPPCGTLPPGARPAGASSAQLQINGLLPNLGTLSGL